MNWQEALRIVIEIEESDALLRAIQPGQTQPLPSIEQPIHGKPLIFHIQVECPMPPPPGPAPKP